MSVPVTNTSLEAESTATGYLYVAFAMIIFYDYALGIDEEVELFWRMPFLGPTWVFLANRYSLLVYGVACLLQVPTWTITTGCETTYIIFYIANLLLFALTAAFAALRVYALSNRHRGAGLGVLLIGMGPVFINLYTTARQSPMYIGDDGICAAKRFYTFHIESILDTAIFASTVLTDLIVIVVTWRKTNRMWLQGRKSGTSSPLIILILRDGLLYFATILVLNVLELVVMRAWVKASSANVAYTSYVVVPVSSILINHFLVDLRQLSLEGSQDDSNYPEVGLTSPGACGPFLSSLDCQCMGEDLRFDTPHATITDTADRPVFLAF